MKILEKILILFKEFLMRNNSFWLIITISLVGLFSELAVAFLIGNLFVTTPNKYLPSILFDQKSKMIAACLFLGVRVFSAWNSTILLAKLQRSLHYLFSITLFKSITTDIRLSEIYKKGVGYYISLAGDECFKMSSAVISVINLIILTLSIFIYCLLLLKTSAVGLIAFASFCIISLLLGFRSIIKIKRLGHVQTELGREASNTFLDGIKNLKSLKCFSSEGYINDLYSKQLEHYSSILYQGDYLSAAIKNIPTIFLVFSFLLIVIFSKISTGSGFLIVGITFFRLLPITGNLYSTALRIISEIKSVEDLLPFLQKKDKVTGESTFKTIERVDNIRLSNLTVYHVDKLILSNINLNFSKNKIYGIKGKSGIGKSSVFDVLLGFNTDFTGEIFINDIIFTKNDILSLKSKIHLVEQKVPIFCDTIAENILLGRSGYQENLQPVLESCLLQDLVLDKGVDHKLYFNGSDLSGGQMQRIGLARGLVGNPDVLILDETLTGIDTVSKKIIVNNLGKLFENKILILISHDEDILNKCDVVYEFNDFL
jgi:ABC-type bacteriocin/lantibiotic exporter with double-glycine peptidase domain